MTGENRDKPGPLGAWGEAGADEPGPLRLGAWPAPEKPAPGDIEATGPIELPPQLKAMAARWERPATPTLGPRKLKPPTKRFFTPLPEPTFGAAAEPQLPSAPLTPVAESAPQAAPGTIVLKIPRPLFWACLLGVVVGGLVAVMLDVAQVRRNQPVLLPSKPAKAAVAETEQPVPVKAAARLGKAVRRPTPRPYPREQNTEFAPQRSITILNAPPKVVVLRPSPPGPDTAAPTEP